MSLADKELNDLILRPRFNFKINHDNQVALSAFEGAKENQENFVVSRVDNHVFIRVKQQSRTIFSPQLHLEIDGIDENVSQVNGLFGPSPTGWTFFMFLHFVLVVLFVGFGIGFYTKWTLGKPYEMFVVGMIAPIIGWVILYFLGKHRKEKSIPEMLEQHHFMRDVLRGL